MSAPLAIAKRANSGTKSAGSCRSTRVVAVATLRCENAWQWKLTTTQSACRRASRIQRRLLVEYGQLLRFISWDLALAEKMRLVPLARAIESEFPANPLKRVERFA